MTKPTYDEAVKFLNTLSVYKGESFTFYETTLDKFYTNNIIIYLWSLTDNKNDYMMIIRAGIQKNISYILENCSIKLTGNILSNLSYYETRDYKNAVVLSNLEDIIYYV